MPLDDVVIPALLARLKEITGPADKQIRAVRYGEQFQVAQPPELWVLHMGGSFPEGAGSNLEQSDWNIELRLLYPFANDQRQAEIVLAALIEPMRDLFRAHLKMGLPTQISRARILSATWLWTVVNENIYRTINLRLAVREKSTARFNE
jgi:hypothetical protein